MQLVQRVFNNQASAALDIVKLNAGAALYACDRAESIETGVELAAAAIAGGKAQEKFSQYIEFTNSFK